MGATLVDSKMAQILWCITADRPSLSSSIYGLSTFILNLSSTNHIISSSTSSLSTTNPNISTNRQKTTPPLHRPTATPTPTKDRPIQIERPHQKHTILFIPSKRHPFQEEAVKEDINHEHWQCKYHRGCHDVVPVRSVVRLEGVQADR